MSLRFDHNETLAEARARNIREALQEDIGVCDWTARLVPADRRVRARVIVREPAVLAGRDWFDGVFAASDLLAMGAIRALAEKNLRVPENVSVIGYDDTPGAASFVPPLTSVHQYLRDGGVLLARKMLGLIEGQPVASEMLPTTLMVRHT